MVEELGVKISIDLQRYRTPSVGGITSATSPRLSPIPTWLWVVDIVDVSEEVRPRSVIVDDDWSWSKWCIVTCYLSLYCCSCIWFPYHTRDHDSYLGFCLPCRTKKWVEQEEEDRRLAYCSNASNRVLVLKKREGPPEEKESKSAKYRRALGFD